LPIESLSFAEDRTKIERIISESLLNPVAHREVTASVVSKKSETSSSASHSGGIDVEGWSPLRDRTPWKVPEISNLQKKMGLLPGWYTSIRPQVAEWLEIMRRIQPYVKVFGIRIPLPIYTAPAIALLLLSAPFIPGPAIYNAILIPILIFGGDIKWVDRGVAFTQPLLWPVVNAFNAIVWTAQHVANALTLNFFKFSRKLNYYPLRKKIQTEQK
jgi:hypothetical protein